MTSELDRDVTLAARAHQVLLEDLDRMIDGFDVGAPSRLPAWTKGHVLAHLVNSGAGHALIFEAAQRGEVSAQYPHGVEGRAADIEAGAGRPAAVQRDALRRSIYQLEACWAASDWQGHGIAPRGGTVQLTELPFLRLREVALHHVDLDIGYQFEDLDDDYVRLELRRLEMVWAARQPMGMTALPSAALALDPPRRLAWLTGRAVLDGLDPAGVF